MRTLHNDTLSALKSDHIRTILVKMDLIPDPIYLNNTCFDVNHNGNTYLGNGSLLNAGSISQDIEIRVATTTIELDAVDPSLVAIFLGSEQQGRDVTLSLAILDSNYSVVGNVIPMSSMIINGSPNITDNPKRGVSVIKQNISSEFANWKQKGGVRTTPASLQRLSPGDTGFNFAAESGKEYKWGSK